MYPLSKDDRKEYWAKEYKATITHTRGLKPKHLIETQRPNEPDNLKDYRVEVFQPETFYEFQKAINDMRKTHLFNKVQENIEDDLHKDFIDILGLRDFFEKEVYPIMIDDPNALLWVYPFSESKIKPPEIVVKVVLSQDIETFEQGKAIFMCDGHKWLITSESTSIIETEGGKEEIIPIYDNRGFFPCRQLGGIVSLTCNGYYYFKSFLSPAVMVGNSVALRQTDNDATRVMCASPVRIVEKRPCTNQECNDGWVDGDTKCGTCGGTGTYMPTGSFAYWEQSEGNMALGETKSQRPFYYEYLNPAVMTEQRADLKEKRQELKESLNQFSVAMAQSAAAKREDNVSRESMLDRIGRHYFKLYEWCLNAVLFYRFRLDKSNSIKVAVPENFAGVNADNMQKEIATLKGNGVPTVILNSKTKEWLKRAGLSFSEAQLDALEMVDPFFAHDSKTKILLFNTGAMDEREFRLSEIAPTLIKFATDSENKAEAQTIAQAALELFKEKYSISPTQILDNNGE
jgi:hypothetical protein